MTPFIQPLLSSSKPIPTHRRVPVGTFAAARASRHTPVGAWSMQEIPTELTYKYETKLPSGVANNRRRSDMFRHACIG